MDARRRVAIDTLREFGMPYRLAITADSRLAVISDQVKGEVRSFSVPDRRSRFTITIPRDGIVSTAEVAGSPSPEGVATSPDGRSAFVTLQSRNQAITIDLTRGAITTYAPTGVWSDGVGFSRLMHSR